MSPTLHSHDEDLAVALSAARQRVDDLERQTALDHLTITQQNRELMRWAERYEQLATEVRRLRVLTESPA